MRLAAKSLLSLSEVTPQAAHRQFVSAGLVSGRPRTYPYTLTSLQVPHETEPVSNPRLSGDFYINIFIGLIQNPGACIGLGVF